MEYSTLLLQRDKNEIRHLAYNVPSSSPEFGVQRLSNSASHPFDFEVKIS
jgi:hypothetical protein